ncbi:MAG: rhomboid family intramembrane serine protease [Cyclobacteriaceae bacterium]|nr:rhomboid family intramembrane serine protease [Cyclobacteriaceae bacterium]
MDKYLEKERFQRSVLYVISFILIIWIVKILEYTTDSDFSSFGIFPRTFHGSIGIFISPFIHGDLYHLFTNTFPLIILGIGILYFYPKIGIQVILLIYIMTGFLVWVAAREAFHIGASGIVYGMFAFLLTGGFIRRDRRTLSISLAILFLYGGSMFSGLTPTVEGISWESHIMGFFAGLFCAIYFRKESILFTSSTNQFNEIDNPKADLNLSNTSVDDNVTYNYTFKSVKNIT